MLHGFRPLGMKNAKKKAKTENYHFKKINILGYFLGFWR